MAHTAPTPAQLKAKFPAFAAVPDVTVDAYLADAFVSGVDTSWPEAQYATAGMAFAAHQMAKFGIGDHGQVAGYARQGVTGLRSGSFSVNLDPSKARAVALGELNATPYGQEYKRLLEAVKGGPRILGGRWAGWDTSTVARQNDGRVLP